MLQGKHSSRAGKAGLDLVQNEKSSHFVAVILHSLKILARTRPDTALALDGLDQEGCRRVGDGFTGFGQVIKRNVGESWNQRFKRFSIFFVPGRTQCPQCLAMISTHGRHNFGPASCQPSKFNGPFDGLGSRITKEKPSNAGRSDSSQLL